MDHKLNKLSGLHKVPVYEHPCSKSHSLPQLSMQHSDYLVWRPLVHLGQLLDSLGERLALGDPRHLDAHEAFRRETGDVRVPEAVALAAERVADAEDAGVEEADHVARIGDLDFLAILPHQQRGTRQPDLLAGARELRAQALLEAPGADS